MCGNNVDLLVNEWKIYWAVQFNASIDWVDFEQDVSLVGPVRDRAKENLRRILNARNQSFTPFKSGTIKLDDFSYAYANDKAVLKHLNLDFKSGEKIGIIGRTGAGKSSMISALFRIREAQTGSIELDGKADLSLFETRQNLSIIPQEPIIFSDSVRGNLDPFCVYDESQVWSALASVGLKNKFAETGKVILKN